MSDTQAQSLESARIVDQNPAAGIAPEDMLIIDSIASGTRAISYRDLCDAVAVTLGIATIRSTADGAMQKNDYDKNHSGVVDNAEKLETHPASYFATASALQSVSGVANEAMQKKVYDADNDGIVDNAKTVDGHTVEKNVPSNAVFTDTVYNDSALSSRVKVTEDTLKLKANGQNITFSVTSAGLLNVKKEA